MSVWQEKRAHFSQNGHQIIHVLRGLIHSLIQTFSYSHSHSHSYRSYPLKNRILNFLNSSIFSLKVSYNNFSTSTSTIQTLAKCANNLVCFHVHKTNIGAIGTKAVIHFLLFAFISFAHSLFSHIHTPLYIYQKRETKKPNTAFTLGFVFCALHIQIIDNLPKNYNLKELFLGGNIIDKKGLTVLCDTLKQNNTLQKLSICDSELSKVLISPNQNIISDRLFVSYSIFSEMDNVGRLWWIRKDWSLWVRHFNWTQDCRCWTCQGIKNFRPKKL